MSKWICEWTNYQVRQQYPEISIGYSKNIVSYWDVIFFTPELLATNRNNTRVINVQNKFVNIASDGPSWMQKCGSRDVSVPELSL
jgi:hypothetical protein